MGAAGQSRLMLLEMCKSVDFLNDWVEAMVMAVPHAKGGKDPTPGGMPGWMLGGMKINGPCIYRLMHIYIYTHTYIYIIYIYYIHI